jgi:anti-anti-sigma factor
VHKSIDSSDIHFGMLGDRRHGVERLSLIGTLDRSTVGALEQEVEELAHPDGAIVLDLHNIHAIDVDAVRVLGSMAQRADDGGWLLCLVNAQARVREAFERAGHARLLGGDVSDVLSSGNGDWAPISLPPLPGQRVKGVRLQVVERSP